MIQQEFRRGYTTHDQISLLPTMQLFYLIVSHSGVSRTSDTIIVFNIFGVSRAEIVNSARIWAGCRVHDLYAVCGLVVDHFIFCAVCFVLTMCIASRHIIASSYANFFDCYKIFCLILVLISI